MRGMQIYDPEKAKEYSRREQSKRRSLGFDPWNKPFPGCEAHHLIEEDVIYIPKELHHSIWHSLTNDINIQKINDLAIEYLRLHKEV